MSAGTALPIVLVAAVAENGVIGGDNRLPWRLRTDLRRFRDLTMGKPVVMGRRTYRSLGRPLPGRQNIVLTRDPSFAADGVEVAHSLDAALALARRLAAANGGDAIMVIGGAGLFAQTLPLADCLHLTLVHATPPGDVHFPAFDGAVFRETAREAHPAGPDDDHAFTFVDYERSR